MAFPIPRPRAEGTNQDALSTVDLRGSARSILGTSFVGMHRPRGLGPVRLDFTNSFIQFLSLTVIWLAPWCGIHLADLLLRRGHYDPAGLHRRGGGAYWYTRGWNIRALLWFVLGIAGAAAFSNSALFKGPLVGLTGGGDLSIFVGLLIGFGGYYASMRRTLDAAAQRASSDLSSDETATQPALDASGSRP